MAEMTRGTVVRRRREEIGLTRPQLCAKVPSLSLSTLIRIENHDGLPRVQTLTALAAALDLSVAEIVDAPELAKTPA